MVLPAKISRFSDNFMLFISSVGFFGKSFLTGLKLIDRIIWYHFQTVVIVHAAAGVKFVRVVAGLKSKFILFTGHSFIKKMCFPS